MVFLFMYLTTLSNFLGNVCYYHPQAVAKFALLTPVVSDILQTTIQHRQQIDKSVRSLKKFSVELFNDPLKGIKTYRKELINILIISSLTLTAVSSLYALHRLGILKKSFNSIFNALKLIPGVNRLNQWAKSINIWRINIPGGQPFVYIGYSGLASLHLYQCYKRLQQHSIKALTSLTGAMIATATLVDMLFFNAEVHWHHSGYGLLMMLAPFRSIEFFGTLMSMDSALYWISYRTNDYDFANIFVENFSQFCFQMISLSILQSILNKKSTPLENNSHK
jgi:hypothetical protein